MFFTNLKTFLFEDVFRKRTKDLFITLLQQMNVATNSNNQLNNSSKFAYLFVEWSKVVVALGLKIALK